ncbi:MAG: hypothetical protein ACRC3B_18825, partial [Bacteroidia bacterium]
AVMRNLSLRLPASGNVIMNTAATVNGNLDLVQGWLLTTSSNLLSIADNGTVSGASDNSFVNGPVQKTGNDAFIFPVGKNTYYAAIGISAPATVGAEFTAEFFQTDPDPSYDVSLRDASLAGISRCEYWLLDRTSGADAVNVTLSWDTTECGANYVVTPSDLRVARWDGALWRDHGNGGTTGGVQTGTVITSGAVTNFSPFTLASFTSLNPLPVELLCFTAAPENKRVKTAWNTGSEINSDYFVVERSAYGSSFEFVARIDAAGYSSQMLQYSCFDENPLPGISYYRLRQVDMNGAQRVYPPVAVNFSAADEITAEIQNNQLIIDFGQQPGDTETEVVVYDAAGRICLSARGSAASLVRLDMPGNTGVYFVSVTSGSAGLRKAVLVAGL